MIWVRTLTVLLLSIAFVDCGSQTPGGQPAPSVPSVSPDPVPPGGGSGPAPPDRTPVLVGAGDIATCTGAPEATARLLDGIAGTVITLGDNAYPKGAEREYRECYDPTWGRHRARTRPSPGNHEYESSDAEPYFNYFGASAGPPGAGYYSYEVGTWLVLSLNSNTNINAQVNWLQDVFARSTHRCTIAYWHHPVYSSGPSAKVAHVQPLWDVLYRAGADVVLSAHDHLYERFAPQDERGRLDPERGMRQFVVGTGGAAMHVSRGVTANSEVRISEHGVLKVTLNAGGYQWDFISVSGIGDTGSGTCH